MYKCKMFAVLACLVLVSCGETFLDVKPSIRQRVPSTFKDYQLILNNSLHYDYSPLVLNYIGADELYVPEGLFNSIPNSLLYNFQKNAYTWAKEIYEGTEQITDWNDAYSLILISNIVIEGLNKTANKQDDWDLTYGSAIFYRAMSYYHLTQSYCLPYDVNDAKNTIGVPLRVESDLTMKVPRSTLAETYEFILGELNKATELLPLEPESIFKPSKLSSYALLARIYLQMGNYDKAEEYASSALAKKDNLMDFNNLEKKNNFSFLPYGKDNGEIILYQSLGQQVVLLGDYFSKIDTNLLNCFSDSDLRKTFYFDPKDPLQTAYIGSYSGSAKFFTGFTTSELYLIRAECYARKGMRDQALRDLNHLRRHRIATERYLSLNSQDTQVVLQWVIEERKLELVLRGTRWEDLRRLNKEQDFAKTLVRELNGQRFELFPNDKRYTWPLPVEAIQIGGYQQNER